MKIRERRGPSQGVIQRSDPHERRPCAPKIEDRPDEETLKQERCARRDVPKMARNVHKLKEKDKATFHSPSDVWCVPAPSSTKPEEREFVVESGASMHVLSRKDQKNGEVQTNEEATVYVYDLDLPFGRK